MLFNATNTYVTINDQWLNDAVSIVWQQQGGVEPIYGYMDREFRTVATKQNIIAGTIGIYFHQHDLFFRYIADNYKVDLDNREALQAKVEREVNNAIITGRLANLLTELDLADTNNPLTELYLDAVKRLNGVTVPNRDVMRPENSDVLGEAGFQVMNGRGATVKIYYGDPADTENPNKEVEVLYNTWFLGRAKTPIENSPRSAGEPAMEFYSFIASRVGREK